MNREVSEHDVANMRHVLALCSDAWAGYAEDGNRARGISMKVNGVAAIVTGAASGLGEATARELARRGAMVAVFDRDSERGGKVAIEIGGVFCNVDVTSDDKVAAAFANARE